MRIGCSSQGEWRVPGISWEELRRHALSASCTRLLCAADDARRSIGARTVLRNGRLHTMCVCSRSVALSALRRVNIVSSARIPGDFTLNF